MTPDPAPSLDIAEFRAFGYLQELNRLFLHPLGLALEVAVADDGTESLGRIWDCRDDPEGIRFEPSVIDPAKVARVDAALTIRVQPRIAALGYLIQSPNNGEGVVS